MVNNEMKSICSFVCLSYVISWAIWLAGMSTIPDLISLSDKRFILFVVAGSFGPTISALIFTSFSGGWVAIKSLARRLVIVKVNWKVYAMTFFLLPVIGITTFLVIGITNSVDLSAIAITAIALMPINALVGGAIFGIGPLGEEMGWRGFLQDRLQGKANPVVIAVIIGLIWSAWHLPLAIRFEDFRSGLSLWEFCALYPFFTMLLAFIMAHLWRLSKGSLLIAVLFHGVSNMTVDIYLINDKWWNFGKLTAVQIYLVILLVYALMAVATELISHTVLPGQHRENNNK